MPSGHNAVDHRAETNHMPPGALSHGGGRNQMEGEWGRKSREREGREWGSEMEWKGQVKKRKGKEKSGKEGKMS